MLFNSYSFLFVYLPIVLVGFFALAKMQLKNVAIWWLFLASIAFYGVWNYYFVSLLLGSIIANFFIGKLIYSSNTTSKRKALLVLGVTLNLGTLFYYKYSNFFISSVLGFSDFTSNLILPLGISFFSFTQIAFLVDAYKQNIEKPEFASYGLFVTFFPHLIAGPVLHHKNMITQFNDLNNFKICPLNISHGIFLFVIGLSKKVLIADPLSSYVHTIFDVNTAAVSFVTSWIGALCYTLQLYFDFSGYSDMAIGLGLLVNMNLPDNFNSPYKANSVIDFWRRWHISLSNFLRDYLYIPLGGSRNGKLRKYQSLFITLFLGGIWHGAGWTFLLWGACHGVFLVINHLWRDLNFRMPNWLARFITIIAVMVTWVIFRAPNVQVAKDILSAMFGLKNFILPERISFNFLSNMGIQFGQFERFNFSYFKISLILLLLLGALFLPNSQELRKKMPQYPIATGLVSAVIFGLCLGCLDQLSEFIYYQF